MRARRLFSMSGLLALRGSDALLFFAVITIDSSMGTMSDASRARASWPRRNVTERVMKHSGQVREL